MGRNLKYKTKEEKKVASNKKAHRYYLRNKEKIKQKNRERYHKCKNDNL